METAQRRRAEAEALAALPPAEAQQLRAFLLSCDGRWLRTARQRHMQLTDSEVVVRMQRYLRLPLGILDGLVGCVARDGSTVIGDCGDELLSSYHPKGDAEWTETHDTACRCLDGAARSAGVRCQLEGGRVRPLQQEDSGASSETFSLAEKRPGDLRLPGGKANHGFTAAGTKEVWADVTVRCPLLPSYVSAASRERGSCAAAGASWKRASYKAFIPDAVYFQPLGFETEGYMAL